MELTGILGSPESLLGAIELASVPGMTLLSAQPIRENVVQLAFDEPVFFSGILEPDDASAGSHYSVAPVAGTFGRDGRPTRPVTPVFAELDPSDPTGATLDVFLDRPMSPSPGQYVIAVTGLSRAADRFPMFPDPQQATFEALFKQFVPPDPESAVPSRDLANPQDGSALAKLPNVPVLGTFNVDSTGDYAIDEGLPSLKKRIVRRLVTSVNGFQHLQGYGIGVAGYGKKLASPSTRSKIAALAQAQILLEPEVVACTVTAVSPSDAPGLVFFVVRVQTNVGQQFRLAVPFSVT